MVDYRLKASKYGEDQSRPIAYIGLSHDSNSKQRVLNVVNNYFEFGFEFGNGGNVF